MITLSLPELAILCGVAGAAGSAALSLAGIGRRVRWLVGDLYWLVWERRHEKKGAAADD